MISAVTATSAREAVPPQSAAAQSAAAQSAAAQAATQAAAASAAAGTVARGAASAAIAACPAADSPGRPNPVASVAPNLGITVLTFHNAAGAVVATAPTRAQLDAYQLYGAPGATPKPATAGRPAGSTATQPGLGLVA